MKFKRYPYMKGLGNQDITVHCMKTQPHSTETAEDLHRFKWYIDSHYLSIRKCISTAFVNWDDTKNQRTDTQLLTCIPATGINHSVWLKNKTLRRTEGKADGICQVHTMLAPGWGEGAELLHCSYRKPWWEPDCRFNVKLNHTKKPQGFALKITFWWPAQKTPTPHKKTTKPGARVWMEFLLYVQRVPLAHTGISRARGCSSLPPPP